MPPKGGSGAISMHINEKCDIQAPGTWVGTGPVGSWKAYAWVVEYAQVFLSKGKKKKAKAFVPS